MIAVLPSARLRLSPDTHGSIALRYANRHGLIAGATGSGKTVTLMRLAEECGAQGIPCVITDVKGDAARLCTTMRKSLPIEHVNASDMPIPLFMLGADVFSRMIGASPAQAAALWALIDGSRIRSIGELITAVTNAPATAMTAGTREAMLRYLRPLTNSKAFGVREKTLSHVLFSNTLTVLDVQELADKPNTYGASMTWLLRTAFETFEEVGDEVKPRLVLIIDEAHTLFNRMNAETLDEFARVMRLIRSRGVGVYFATQDPTDIPNVVAQQLATRVLHAMRPGNTRLAPYFRSLFVDDGTKPESLYALTPGRALMGGLDDKGGLTPMRLINVLKPAVALNLAPPSVFADDIPEPTLPVARDLRGKGAPFGRKPTYSAEGLADARAELHKAVFEQRIAARQSVAIFVVLAALTFFIAWLVWPPSDEPMSIIHLLRGGAAALLTSASALFAFAVLLPLADMFRSGK